MPILHLLKDKTLSNTAQKIHLKSFLTNIIYRRFSNEYQLLFTAFFFRGPSYLGEIIPLDKWEILHEQIEYDEELGRGAFGVVYKATLKRRAGMELFQTGEKMARDPKKTCRVVAVKVLKGNLKCRLKSTNKEQQGHKK